MSEKKQTDGEAYTGGGGGQPPCSEYYVTVTLRIPHRLLGRITKKAIQSKDVEIMAADWDKVREIYSPKARSHFPSESEVK